MSRLLLVIPIVALMASVVIGAHFYLFQRLVVDASLPAGWTTALKWLLVVCAALLVVQPIAERTVSHRLGRFVAWPASLWMGFGFLLLAGAGASELVTLVIASAAEAAGSGAAASDLGFERGRAALVVLLAGAGGAIGLRNAFAGPEHVRVEIVLPRWPEVLDGFRIVQISDIHIGPILDRRFSRSVTDRVNALHPDLVAVTGDLVDGSVSKLEEEVAPFADLKARLGVFFVTGNHDHYSGGNQWAEQAARLGMRVLRNQRVTIESEGACFELAGVDDHHSGMMPGEDGEDLDAALGGRPEQRAVVLLAHDPSTFKRASKMGVDLQLSGHTHGGQIWPFNLLVRLAIPFVAGHYRRGDAQLYVSQGTGFWGPPMRLRSKAEITEVIVRGRP